MKQIWSREEEEVSLVLTPGELITITQALKTRRDTLTKWITEVNYGSDYQIQFRDDITDVNELLTILSEGGVK